MVIPDNILILESIRALRQRLPPDWALGQPAFEPGYGIDATITLQAPDERTSTLNIEAKKRLDPRSVRALLDNFQKSGLSDQQVVVAPYLSQSTRECLRSNDVSYLDLTGNVRIVVRDPGLYIETQGASEDPNREERPARSLRGLKAGRIVRALVDNAKLPGVRELAATTAIDAGYVSRVLALLDAEALITRVGHGRLQSVDWPPLLRRWAREAPIESRGVARTYLEPRGLSAITSRLSQSDERYAITGSLAAALIAPIASPRLATVWMRDATLAAQRLGLRPADAGANVIFIEPADDSVFVGATERHGRRYAALSQVVADLLTSPGRGPAEAEELITWMLSNEEKWRQ